MHPPAAQKIAPAAIAGLLLLAASCGTTPARPAATTSVAASTAAASGDPLGAHPSSGTMPEFKPTPAVAFAGPGGSRVLLFERHTLPLVTVSVVVPYGSAAEPVDLPGLAHISAQLIDQGSGGLDAGAFSRALEDLGAQLSSGADRDSSSVTLECLAPRLSAALPLMLSAIAAPQHRAEDYARVQAMWLDELRQRSDEPGEVARLVASAALYGPSTPYGHPSDGIMASAKAITLERADAWHRSIWRPDAATIVVAGDVARDQVAALLAHAAWTVPDAPAPALAAAALLPQPRARTIVVVRPGAPQVVAMLVRDGVPAADPARPRLDVMDVALGGSFTSRLNQDLREDHGWCYGAGSRFVARRSTGMFVASSAIRADAISDALREMRSVIGDVASHGITAEELAKSRAQCETEAVDSYSTISRIASRLAVNAALGLGPTADADELAAQRTATVEGVAEAAKRYVGIEHAILVLVGPEASIRKAIADNALPAPEFCDGEAGGLTMAPLPEGQ